MQNLGPCTHVLWDDDNRLTVIQWFDGRDRAVGLANQLHLFTQAEPGVLTASERAAIHAKACRNHILRKQARTAQQAEKRAASKTGRLKSLPPSGARSTQPTVN